MNTFVFSFILITFIEIISSESIQDIILEPFMSGPPKTLFRAYHEVYRKQYDLDSVEGVRRYKIFKENMKYIQEENSKGHSYTLGITPFTDMTNEEYREQILRPEEEVLKEIFDMEKTSTRFLSKVKHSYTPGTVKVDWTDSLGRVKNQGRCGSCWAFSTYSAIESNYKIKSGRSVELAPQQLIDCDTLNRGCRGGWPSYAYRYARDNGVALEIDYPYTSGKTGRNETCSYNPQKGLKIVSDKLICPYSNCKMEAWSSFIKNGPIQVVVDAGSREFQNFKTGFAEFKNCTGANHAILAVALLNDEKGDYIRIQNSWGTGWGDKGFMNARYNQTSQTCFITQLAWLPVIKSNSSLQDENTEVPTFYSECNFEGKQLSSKESLKRFPEESELDRNILSAKTFGYDVSLYSQADCKGRVFRLRDDDQCFSRSENREARDAINNALSVSIIAPLARPKEGCIIIYTDSCFLGADEEICGDVEDLGALGFDDRTVSIAIGPGIKGVTAYIDPHYEGMGFGLRRSSANLNQGVTKLLHNSISSIKIFREESS
jgi:hypothetical protein